MTPYDSCRSRVRRDIESLMEGGPDETRFAQDDAGVWHRLDDHVMTRSELAEDFPESTNSRRRYGTGYSVKGLTRLAPDLDADDADDPNANDAILEGDDDDTDNETEETTMIEKTDAERAEAARQGTMRSEPDTAIAQAVKAYIAANGGTFNDALTAVQAADPAMWRAYARWLVHKKATNDKTRDDLADLALEYKYAAGQHLMAMAEAEAAMDNSAALAKATTIFTSEHGGGLAGIDKARSYLRIKRPDLFQPDEGSTP